MTKTPTLYRLAADRQYSSIPARVKSNPDDLLWTDRYGSTALHILCQARNVDRGLLSAVDAILHHAPEQVSWPNVATWTPLHFAVEKRLIWGEDSYATALILRLIRACPAAVSLRTKTGFRTKTPFHIACEADADYQVLRAMLVINPALATEPYVKRDIYSFTENPLQLLWRTQQSYPNNLAGNSGSSAAEVTSSNSSSSGGVAGGTTERKMALLLRAAHCGTVKTSTSSPSLSSSSSPSSLGRGGGAAAAVTAVSRPFRLLDAACSVRCPRDYFSRVLSEHVHQVSEPDEHGLLPLHYAVQQACVDSQSYTQFVVEALLEVYRGAAKRPDRAGRLPLHVAVSSDVLMTWHKGGVRELTYAYTNALRRPDPSNGLCPFLASAEAAAKSLLHLSTTYELLLAAPEIVQSYSRSDPPAPCNDRFELIPAEEAGLAALSIIDE